MNTNIPNAANKIRLIIVDDEPEACQSLTAALADCPVPVEIAGIAHNTAAAERLINEVRPNAVFLDINMPGENAFQFLDRVNTDSFEIVFVTAYDEFAIKALKLNAVDYILKPVCGDELAIALQKLATRISDRNYLSGILSYNDMLNEQINRLVPQKITFRDCNATEVVDFSSLYYIEAKGSYSHIVFRKSNTEKTMLVSHPIAEYEELLPSDIFYRIHKSYLVNCQHIHHVKKDDYSVSVADKFILPVSRRRYADMINFIKSQAFNRTQFASR